MIPFSHQNLHYDQSKRSQKIINTYSIDNQPSWQEAMKNAIRSPGELIKYLGLQEKISINAEKASAMFSVLVPLSFADRMEKGNPHDPLLQQVLPVTNETLLMPEFSKDPLGEESANPCKGVLHKYRNRLLLFPSTHCAINCRYCFRRHFPYEKNQPNKREFLQALEYIQKQRDITEVIYSGGDPLAINDNRLSWLTEKVAGIDHVQRLRIHTRLPIVIPERINDALLNWLSSTRLKPVIVVHSNHPNEINDSVKSACKRLTDAGVVLLNQSVLLKGINDCASTLKQLNEKLFDCNIIPYYLHLLDRVQGVYHFEVAEEKAQRIVGQLSAECSGYMVPRLVREEKGLFSKVTIAPLYE